MLKACRQLYQSVDFHVRVCGRPEGHHPAGSHYIRPFPTDPRPEPLRFETCAACEITEGSEAFTMCEDCGTAIHSACARPCQGCGSPICPSCEKESTHPEAFLCRGCSVKFWGVRA